MASVSRSYAQEGTSTRSSPPEHSPPVGVPSCTGEHHGRVKPVDSVLADIPRGLNRRIAGSWSVDESLLQKRLGLSGAPRTRLEAVSSWRVWVELCARRDRSTGQCRATVKDIAFDRGWHPRSVTECIARLVQAKLVQPSRGRTPRVVFGNPALNSSRRYGGEMRCAIPEGTAKWIASTLGRGAAPKPGNGGKRLKAGRLSQFAKLKREAELKEQPMGRIRKRMSNTTEFSVQSPANTGEPPPVCMNQKTPSRNQKNTESHNVGELHGTPEKPRESGGAENSNLICMYSVKGSSPSERNADASGAAHLPFGGGDGQPAPVTLGGGVVPVPGDRTDCAPGKAPTTRRRPLGGQRPVPPPVNDSGGAVSGDPVAYAEALEAYQQRKLPRESRPVPAWMTKPSHPVMSDGGVTAKRLGVRSPFAYWSVIAELDLHTPKAPKLNPSDPPDRWAWLLQKWFEGCAKSRTGKSCWSFGGVLRRERVSHVAHSSLGKLLIAFARKAIELEVSPASWIAWSMDVWRDQEHPATGARAKLALPPVGWMFSVSRLEEREGWFQNEAVSYEGREPLPLTSAQGAFMRVQAEYGARLGRLTDESPDSEVVAIYEEAFPGGFDRCVAELREAQTAVKQRLLERVHAGEWIWRF